IARTVDEEKLDCGFRYLPGYLYSEESPDQIVQEPGAARASGIELALLDRAPLPFPTKKALRFERQAQFHPLRYLLPLARQVAQRGGLVHEQTRALDVRDGEPCTVRTAQGLVRATHVLVCTHTPVNDKFFMHTKLAQYRSYVVTARPVQRIDGLFWDDADPYHYLRMHDGQLIAGGEDHKVGQKANTNEAYDRLGEYVRARFDAAVEGEWSAQVVEPVDGLPYIGRNSLNARSEEHTSELQSPYDLVCRLLLEKKKQKKQVVLYKNPLDLILPKIAPLLCHLLLTLIKPPNTLTGQPKHQH